MTASDKQMRELYDRAQAENFRESIQDNYQKAVDEVRGTMFYGRKINIWNPVEVAAAMYMKYSKGVQVEGVPPNIDIPRIISEYFKD